VVWALSPPTRPASPPGPDPVAPRIVALSPAIAVILRDLSHQDAIVGRHGWDMVLPKSVPVCGDQSSLEYEAILRVAPTHILTEWGARDLPPRLATLSAEHGWIVKDYTLLSLDEILHAAADLDTIFSAPSAKGHQVNPAITALTNAWSPHPGRFAAAGKILLLESLDPPAAVGPGSFHQQILERLGATPAITQGKAYMTLDAEEVLRLAPDGIFILAPREPGAPAAPAPTAAELRSKLGRLGTLLIPAVEKDHVAVIDDPLCLLPSTALLGATRQMEKTLESWSAH
jgi:ABC-type hemin transport system substrate-binding protein